MATYIAPTEIVVEVLKDDNYDDWSACMKSYMLAQDLLDFIEPNDHQEGEEVDSKASRKKNAAALHAIQISCAPHILSKIRHITSAKIAWDTLANLQEEHSPSHKEQSVGEESESSGDDESQAIGDRSQSTRNESEAPGQVNAGVVSQENTGPLLDLYKHAYKGDWDATRAYLSQYPDAKTVKIIPYGGTALHVAAGAGNLKIVEELVKLMSEEELEIQDVQGKTALCSAVTVGITEMAECLVRKNQNLVTIVDKRKRFPLSEACVTNRKDMALYLYSVTPFDFLCQDNGKYGSYFLQYAIATQMLDIAFDFLHRFPYMTTAMDDVSKSNALNGLSTTPEIFPSGNRLAFWQQWIYSCIPMQPIATANGVPMQPIVTADGVRIDITYQSQSESKNIILQVLSQLRGFAINLLTFLGIKQIHDLKKIHLYSEIIIRCMCKYISTLSFEEHGKADIKGAFLNAVKRGNVEFVIEVVKACPYLMRSGDGNSRGLFMSSIAYRQEKVFSLFYGLEEGREGFVSLADKSGNTLLHLAAELSPSSQLARISGAALHMQRELQWYKEVESISNPLLKNHCNKKNLSARELFTQEHKELLVKGEKWMKQAATSCTVVGALIITIMFTAAFTVPGGYNQNTGYPIFKDKKTFTIFLVSDAFSLFSSSTSVLMFLAILTSRYAEEDFLESLPKKLIVGLSTLFISIAAMMVAFCAALVIVLDGRLQIIIPIVLLAGAPVTIFMLLQFPLLVEIFVSTYGPGIFNKKMKRWY